MFVRSTDPIIDISTETRIIFLSDLNSSTEYCSDLQNKDISVACRAVGIPEPQVNVLVNGNITEPFEQASSEVVIRLPPVPYGETVIFECQASTNTTTLNVTVNLTYTCKLSWLYTGYYLKFCMFVHLGNVSNPLCVI